MYAVDTAAVQAFWVGLRGHLIAAGLKAVPDRLSMPTDLMAHWRSPAVLLSQTCGYPLVTALAGQVRYVATPRFLVNGCEGPRYRSAVIVRGGEPARMIDDLRGRTVAFNGVDSQSGYNALRALVAPAARAGRFFARAVETGSHRASIMAVKAGEADVAAIDAVTFAHVSRVAPAEVEGLRVLEYTDAAPGLPMITALSTTDAELAALRLALTEASADAAIAQARASLHLEGFDVLPEAAYAEIEAMRIAAFSEGYPDLA